ncbi:Short chain dehydrogenase sirQ [Cladobotryum mycophilum]|uniref:Short chain dehydrogenase sirQ n=1 Tax=Cladobotryum mycophilum TaxID=491253 RepID=A0ABR0SJ65_9HYPO
MASTTSSSAHRTALVFGASGITGWAVLREALQYPTANAFHRVIGLSNRPMDRSRFLLPEDKRLILAHGIDLTTTVDDVAAKLSGIESIGDVTDVYFAAYFQPAGASDFEGHEILKEVNVRMLETAILAVERVSPSLRFWTLQTGGKSYGNIHVRQLGPPKVPCKESDPRIPQPYEDQVFYYAQHDVLQTLSAGKTWRFAEIRPDLVIGFVPGGNNAMNFSQALSVFLSFYADRETGADGKTKQVPFPGPAAVYNARATEVGQKTLARAHIFASNLVDAPNGEIYNVGDSPLTTGNTWDEKWSRICRYFGLEGIAPEGEGAQALSVGAYMSQHEGEWDDFEQKYKLVPGIIKNTSWEFLDVLLTLAAFDRHYDLSKIAAAGFEEQSDVVGNYEETFALMKRARILP